MALSTVTASFANSYTGSNFLTNGAMNRFYLGLDATVNALVLTNLPVRAITQYGDFANVATPSLKAFAALVGTSPRLVAFTTVARLTNLTWPYGG